MWTLCLAVNLLRMIKWRSAQLLVVQDIGSICIAIWVAELSQIVVGLRFKLIGNLRHISIIWTARYKLEVVAARGATKHVVHGRPYRIHNGVSG